MKKTGVTCHPTNRDLRMGSHHRMLSGLRLRGRLRSGGDALDLHGWLPGSSEGRHNVRSSRPAHPRAQQAPSPFHSLLAPTDLLAQTNRLGPQTLQRAQQANVDKHRPEIFFRNRRRHAKHIIPHDLRKMMRHECLLAAARRPAAALHSARSSILRGSPVQARGRPVQPETGFLESKSVQFGIRTQVHFSTEIRRDIARLWYRLSNYYQSARRNASALPERQR